MSKKLSTLMMGLAAVALVAGCNRTDNPQSPRTSQNDSAVVAGKDTAPPTSANPANPNPANPSGPTTEPGARPGAPGTSAGANNPGATPGQDQYSAELRKCDAMPASERARCVEQAKKQHGQM